jgi:hypothetical protein
VPSSVLADDGLTRNDWRVFVALALHANTLGEARPSQTALAAMAGLSRRTVRRSLDRLDARGHVFTDDRGGGNRAARYVLAGFVDDPSGAPVRPTGAVNRRTSAPKAARVGAPVRPKPDADAGGAAERAQYAPSMGAICNTNGRTSAPRTDEQMNRGNAHDAYTCGHPIGDGAPGAILADGRTYCGECAALLKGTADGTT